MFNKILVCACLLLLLFAKGVSQENDSLHLLKEVCVISDHDHYLIGNRTETLNPERLEVVSSSSLGEAIARYYPVYAKSDAGGLSTIRLRGTASGHTAVLCNGFNVNSLTLGLTNLSAVPLFLFDEVKVQYGSSSSLHGTDAIGGSIQLNNRPEWGKGLTAGLQAETGSFGHSFHGVKFGYTKRKWHYAARIFSQSKTNRFPFLNTAVKDFEQNAHVDDVQQNAALENRGMMHAVYYLVSDHLYAYARCWLGDNWRQVQPNMSTNYYGGSFDEISNTYQRASAGLKYYKGAHRITADVGFVSDGQLYNGNLKEEIRTHTVSFRVDHEVQHVWKGTLHSGVKLLKVRPEVYAYKGVESEMRTEFYSAFKRPLFEKVALSLMLREVMVKNYRNHFSPSVGLNYLVIKKKTFVCKGKTSMSHSYKIPTFNDRYWYPGGNPNLLPETGMSFEAGVECAWQEKSQGMRLHLAGYQMAVDNWIQWRASNTDGFWRPINLKKVSNAGVECGVQFAHQKASHEAGGGIRYSLSRVVEVKSYDGSSIAQGRQLIYTPTQMGRIFADYRHRQWYAKADASYTGRRFTESYSMLDGYLIVYLLAGRDFKWGKHECSLELAMNNLLDKKYQNQELYAMPGRNYSVKFNYSIHKPKKIKNEEN